jgi:hypothetical protein
MSASSSEDCVVCLDSKAKAVFAPCGHRCCCLKCAQELTPKLCPKCRAPIVSHVTQIFD